MSEARKFAEQTLDDWGITDRVDDVRLCVSELATNALLHGTPGSGGILVRIRTGDHLVRVEVRDNSSALPKQRFPDDESPTGRGLLLVAACADGWGVDRYAEHKVVWADFKIDTTEAMKVISC
ncbi:ATP-binding protein [Streptomyces ferrugineus]|uniref:ATP-binding protein n=1 Tax=Streptomyces ferrugineus TaxID=1413221 RepID=UPI00223F5979|nr:ATP-binding protein [Streptomyces ferrugineus]